MSKQTTLEQQIAAALRNERIASSELYRLIAQTESAIVAAEQTAAAERARSLDPALAPDPAEALQAAQLAELAAARLQTQAPRLRAHLERQLDHERRERWTAEYQRLRPLHADAVTKFETLPGLLDLICAILTEVKDIDRLTQQLAISSPDGEARRLAPIAERATRIEFAGEQIWPPRSEPLDFSGYRPDDRLHANDCGPNWWIPGVAAADAAAKRETAELRALEEGRRQFYMGRT